MPAYRFSLAGVSLPDNQDPLGLWDVPPQEVVSFAIGSGAGAPSEPIWRIELPGSIPEARAILSEQARATDLAQRDLAQASQELVFFDPTGVASSFSTSDELAAPKSALLTAVDELDPSNAVSFGLFGAKQTQQPKVDKQSCQQWQAFMDQVRQVVGNYARIETALDEVHVGQTSVSWTGDMTTHFEPGVSPEAMRTHLYSVHLALSSRIALMRVVSVVATGAAGLALKAAIPGGQVLLLPAVWRFVRDVVAELRRSWPQLEHLVSV
ncbi:MAG: hypothetical protein JXA89_04920 [Anaerolineae bacterium]|nr:hypothetical protein [Anaerolineae bacterium]